MPSVLVLDNTTYVNYQLFLPYTESPAFSIATRSTDFGNGELLGR
jgi:hypothetical protein